MPTKRAQAQAQSQATATVSSTTTSTRSPSTSTAPPPTTPSKPSKRTQADSSNSPSAILLNLFTAYDSQTPQRVKLIDSFLAFLVGVGVLQFVYCCLAGNYPFNAFLSGFSATVGQFVLTASLRIQTNPENKSEFSTVSHERAFADYVFGSLLLHFFCVNFIN